MTVTHIRDSGPTPASPLVAFIFNAIMSALQFLNKKSWHTSTIKNNEKVWLREQEAAKEQARIEELQKQIEEERRQQDLQALEEQSGRLDPSSQIKRRRLNWMYEYGRDDSPDAAKAKEEKEREDVMLGKKKVDLETLEDDETKERITLIDEEAKLKEDPMSQILEFPSSNGSYPKETSEKARQKALRKEERRRIRENKRAKREERERKKRRHSKLCEPKVEGNLRTTDREQCFNRNRRFDYAGSAYSHPRSASEEKDGQDRQSKIGASHSVSNEYSFSKDTNYRTRS